MKKITALLIIYMLMFMGSRAYAAHSLKITDYDTTVSGAKETRLTLDYDKLTSMDPYGTTKASQLNWQFDLTHNNFYDSYDRSWSYGIQLSQDSMPSTGLLPPPTLQLQEKTFAATASYRDYFIPGKNIYQGIGVDYLAQTLTLDDQKTMKAEGYQATISYMIGMGHLVDITPIAEAGVLEDRLMEAGLLNGNLSKRDMLKLAELIRKWRMGEYTYKNQDTAKGKFLKDISAVLEASGKLTRPIGGFEFWRISECRNVNYARTKGEVIELSTSAAHDSTIIHFYPLPHGGYTSNQNNAFNIRYYRYLPIDWAQQIYFTLQQTTKLNPDAELYAENSLFTALVYNYDLTNNIWFSAGYDYNRLNYKNSSLNEQIDWGQSNTTSMKRYMLDFHYKIEDYSITTFSIWRAIRDSGNSQEYVSLSQSFYL